MLFEKLQFCLLDVALLFPIRTAMDVGIVLDLFYELESLCVPALDFSFGLTVMAE